MLSSPNFHSKIIKRHSPAKKRLLSFPLLFFREGAVEAQVWKNNIFQINFQLLKQFSPLLACEKETKVKTRFLESSFWRRKHEVLQGMSDTEGMSLRNKDADGKIQRMIPNTQKIIYFRYSSASENFIPITSLITVGNTLRRRISGRCFLCSLITSPKTDKLAFFSGEESRKLINSIYFGEKTSEESLKTSNLVKKGIQALNQPILRSVSGGNVLPDENRVSGQTISSRNSVSQNTSLVRDSVYKGSAILNSTYFPELTFSPNSKNISPSGHVSELESYINSFPTTESYPRDLGKELVFNKGTGVNQELEREVAAIKEELLQVEKASQASYSSILSKMENELRQKLEINRISEQVIQQIAWRLKIEKERRGIL